MTDQITVAKVGPAQRLQRTCVGTTYWATSCAAGFDDSVPFSSGGPLRASREKSLSNYPTNLQSLIQIPTLGKHIDSAHFRASSQKALDFFGIPIVNFSQYPHAIAWWVWWGEPRGGRTCFI
jgi:hypothetical protein